MFPVTVVSSSFKQTDFDRDGLLYVINQDIKALGMIQRYYEQNTEEAVEVSVPSDYLDMLSRRIIADMVRAKERT